MDDHSCHLKIETRPWNYLTLPQKIELKPGRTYSHEILRPKIKPKLDRSYFRLVAPRWELYPPEESSRNPVKGLRVFRPGTNHQCFLQLCWGSLLQRQHDCWLVNWTGTSDDAGAHHTPASGRALENIRYSFS